MAKWDTEPPVDFLSPAAVAKLRASLTAARDGYARQQQLATAAKNATFETNSAFETMDADVRGAVAAIRGFAELSADPDAVLGAAELGPISPRTPKPAPMPPTAITTALTGDGSVAVAWNGKRAGVAFSIRRQLTDAAGVNGEWQLLGTSSTQRWIDATVPAGTVEASYQIRGTRGGKDGGWSNPGGLLFVPGQAGTQGGLKIAA